jgi:predicted nucleotidyltransferase
MTRFDTIDTIATMRLSVRTQTIIRDTANGIFGPDAIVTVFGSRVDDSARGGDIDLLVQSEKPIQQRERKALQLVARLQISLGDQPIDVLVLDPQTVRQPVHEEAIRTGVRL